MPLQNKSSPCRGNPISYFYFNIAVLPFLNFSYVYSHSKYTLVHGSYHLVQYFWDSSILLGISVDNSVVLLTSMNMLQFADLFYWCT